MHLNNNNNHYYNQKKTATLMKKVTFKKSNQSLFKKRRTTSIQTMKKKRTLMFLRQIHRRNKSSMITRGTINKQYGSLKKQELKELADLNQMKKKVILLIRIWPLFRPSMKIKMKMKTSTPMKNLTVMKSLNSSKIKFNHCLQMIAKLLLMGTT